MPRNWPVKLVTYSSRRPPFRSNKGKVTVTVADRLGPSGHVFSNAPNRARLFLPARHAAREKASPNEKQSTSSIYNEEQIIMFETAVQEKRTTLLWGIIMGVVAFAALLGAGYALIA